MSDPGLPIVLSFRVVEIKEVLNTGAATVFTVLKKYGTDETITVPGRHWDLGQKVDFKEWKTA